MWHICCSGFMKWRLTFIMFQFTRQKQFLVVFWKNFTKGTTGGVLNKNKTILWIHGVYLVFLQLFIHFKIGHSHAGIVNISGANISHFVHFWLADTSMSFTTMLMKIARQGTQCISIDVLAGFCAVETGLPCGTKYISPSLHSLKCLHANI